MEHSDYFLAKADECFSLARFARTTLGTKFEVATNIEAMGNEFMRKAVEVETAKQKLQRRL